MFQLTKEEYENLISQIVISNIEYWGLSSNLKLLHGITTNKLKQSAKEEGSETARVVFK